MKRGFLIVILPALMLFSMAALPQDPRPSPAGNESYWPTHGWRSSSPEAQGMDSAALAQAFDFVRRSRIPIHSFLIIRNGTLVLDAYFYPFEEGCVHDVASVTKSVTATLVGIAVGEHRLRGVSEPALEVFSGRDIGNRDERKSRMTIENLLTMTSGLDCRVEQAEITLRQMLQSKDWIQYMLDLPMAAEPGSRFSYCSGGMHLLSGIISRTTGASALDFARRALFQPLGIEDVAWPSDPQGISHGWGDLHLRPRDMAKLGYLWLKRGRWEGRQIIPSEWIEAATEVHAHPDFGSGEYGYGFWVYPQRDPPIFEALGRGGQRISVVPARNIVVVFTGGEFEPGDVGKYIGASIKSDGPLPENPEGAARLAAAVRAAARAPAASPAPVNPASARVSGTTYAVEANPAGLESFSLTFPGGAEAVAQFEFADGRRERRPLGLDGVPRLSPAGRFGLPVAMAGGWENGDTFAFDYDEVANINCYRFRLTFAGDGVSIGMRERTGLVEARFSGKVIGRRPSL